MTVDGDEAEVEVDGRDVRITPAEPIAEGDEFEVEIDYGGVPEPVLSAGFPTGWLTADDGGAYVIGEPDGAATWFPGNDHPSDKAGVDVSRHGAARAGRWPAQRARSRARSGTGGDITWSWSEDDPMATYLVHPRHRAVPDGRGRDRRRPAADQLLPRGPGRPARAETFCGRRRHDRRLRGGLRAVPVRRVRGDRRARRHGSGPGDPDPVDLRPGRGRASSSSGPTSWPTSGSATR